MKKSSYLFLFFSSSLIALAALAAIAATLSRVSIGNTGEEANGASVRSSISPSGKLIAFESLASNLIANDNNNSADIFVSGIESNGRLFRTSIGRKRIQANGPSNNPSVSAKTPNGAYLIAYASDATNLGRNLKKPDTNQFQDIYATLFPKAFTFRISRGLDGGLANAESDSPDVTLVAEPNRLFVVYASKATNLTSDDQNIFKDIYLARVTAPSELKEDSTLEDKFLNTRISKGFNGAETDGASASPRISGDGNFIVYESEATNLTAKSVSEKQIYLYDVKKNLTTLISQSTSGIAGNANSQNPSINYNGRYIVYTTVANNILNDGVGVDRQAYQVMRFDRLLNKTERVNVTAEGISGNARTFVTLTASIEASGRFVVFSDRATNLIANDDNDAADVFIKDMATGNLEKISNAVDGGSTNAASLYPAINRTDFTALNGLASFTSAASNLVSGDNAGEIDLFVSNLTFPSLPFSPTTRLDVPPAVSLSGSNAKLTFEKFSGVIKKSAGIAKRSSTKIQYEITYTRDASEGRSKEVKKLISKKNTLSLNNLKPGTYSSTYRAQSVQNNKVVSKSSKSPAQRFTIVD